MKLTKRQSKIVQAVPVCRVLADVGCDHGYVGAQALISGKCGKTLFCDVSAPSLEKARRLACEQALTETEFLCQDGLGNVKCDVAVIAGMGGLEIVSILDNARFLPQSLVLQPMRNVEDVRDYLCRNYQIVGDETFFDKKYYHLIIAERGSDSLTPLERRFGRSNLRSPSDEFANYLEKEKIKYQKILEEGGKDAAEQLKLLESAIAVVKGEGYAKRNA